MEDTNKVKLIVPMEKRLQMVQNKLVGGKTSKNSFGKYNYRNVEDILTEVKPLLAANDLVLKMTDHLLEMCGEVYLQAEVILSDAKGESLDCQGYPSEIITRAFAREPKQQGGMSPSQMTGTASSYARKYALGAMFLLSGEACPDYASELDNIQELSKSRSTPQDKDKDKDKDKDNKTNNKEKLEKTKEKLGIHPLDVENLGADSDIPCNQLSDKKLKDLLESEFDYLFKHRNYLFDNHPNFVKAMEEVNEQRK
jgi:hypothetical protein